MKKIDVRPSSGLRQGGRKRNTHECVCLLARPDCCRSIDFLGPVDDVEYSDFALNSIKNDA